MKKLFILTILVCLCVSVFSQKKVDAWDFSVDLSTITTDTLICHSLQKGSDTYTTWSMEIDDNSLTDASGSVIFGYRNFSDTSSTFTFDSSYVKTLSPTDLRTVSFYGGVMPFRQACVKIIPATATGTIYFLGYKE